MYVEVSGPLEATRGGGGGGARVRRMRWCRIPKVVFVAKHKFEIGALWDWITNKMEKLSDGQEANVA